MPRRPLVVAADIIRELCSFLAIVLFIVALLFMAAYLAEPIPVGLTPPRLAPSAPNPAPQPMQRMDL